MGFDIFVSNEIEANCIDDKIISFNKKHEPFTQDKNFISLNFHIKNDTGLIIAGINSSMYCWGILYVDVLFVEENHRDGQLGSLLLNKVETEAKKLGSTLSHLDTFDWQAKDFYLKKGYEIFGILNDCPKNHNRYYLKKIL